jgi:hypothetical protein
VVFTIDKLPFTTEKGDGTKQRTVTMALGTPQGAAVNGWVFDATEVPSGITFDGAPVGPVITP